MHQYRILMSDPTDREIAAVLDRDCGPWRCGVFCVNANPFDGKDGVVFKGENGVDLVCFKLTDCLDEISRHAEFIDQRLSDVGAQARERGEDPDEWRWCTFAINDYGDRQVVFLKP